MVKIENIHKPTERVMKVLQLISLDKLGYTLTEISEKTNIPKSTLHPILQTLCYNKFIAQDKESKKYVISINTFKLGNIFLENLDILPIIRKYMEKIVAECDEICQLGVLDKGNVLYIEKIDPVQPIRLESSVGTTLPAYATALGKSLLSQHSKFEIQKLYKNRMKKITKNTITDIDELYSNIVSDRINNITHEIGENNEQIECLSVPLVNKGEIFAALSVSLPIYRSTSEKIKQIKDQLLINKDKIEKEVKNFKIDTTMFFT